MRSEPGEAQTTAFRAKETGKRQETAWRIKLLRESNHSWKEREIGGMGKR